MSEFVSSEMKLTDTPIGKGRKYRQWYRCPDCGHKWASKWGAAPPKKDPACPNPSCSEVRQLRQAQIENQRLRAMLESQQTPAIGGSAIVKAIDFTAETTMQSYGMTDLKDNIREGETMAPKLPGQAQAAADSYFKPEGSVKAVDFGTNRMRTIQAKHLDAIGKRAMAGGYRRQAVSPIEVIPKEVRNQSPLSLVRTAPNPHYKG